MIEIHEAGIINFLRTLFWLVFFYYLFKLLVRYIAPFFIRKVVDNFQKKAQDFNDTKNESFVKEGETIIDKKPTKKPVDNQVGEYVDFEEID